uniref:Uncharacterized protein n=1 Tax=Anguilla anguilla TaxID=7936 RepID=A0A0E9XBZ4_ANGAN
MTLLLYFSSIPDNFVLSDHGISYFT